MEGHLLIGGRKGFKGRIVDSQMLASLKGGCVRTGANSSQSFYTLHRYFCISEKQLDNKAHVVIGTRLGMRVCPGGVREVKSLVQLGGVALNNQLVYHRTIHDTLLALDSADSLALDSAFASSFFFLSSFSISSNLSFVWLSERPCLSLAFRITEW